MEGLSVLTAPRQFTIPLSEMLRPIISESSKIAIPISGFASFANFKYVQGVPAQAGEGFPFSKLQLLDSIIGNLVSLREHRALEIAPKDTSVLNDSQLDAAIQEMAKKLQVASTVVPMGIPAPIGEAFGIAVSQTGTAFSLTA